PFSSYRVGGRSLGVPSPRPLARFQATSPSTCGANGGHGRRRTWSTWPIRGLPRAGGPLARHAVGPARSDALLGSSVRVIRALHVQVQHAIVVNVAASPQYSCSPIKGLESEAIRKGVIQCSEAPDEEVAV